MYRKSNYRLVAAEGRAGKLHFMRGSRYLPLGVLTAMALAGSNVRGETSGGSPASGEGRTLSAEIREAVIEKLPKFAPSTLAKTPEPPPENTNDSSGDILHLPKITVKAAAPTLPSRFDLLTPKGRLDLAMKSSPGLRIGNFFGLNNGIAMAIQAEERDVEKKAALAETVRRTTSNDGPESKRIMRLLKAALQRPNTDWAGNSRP